MKNLICNIFGYPLTYILILCLLIGSCIYKGTEVEQSAIKKLTGIELTKWEVFFYSPTIILDNPKNEKKGE